MSNRTDTFVRSNGSLSAAAPSDAGSSWVQWSGTWVVASNTANESSNASQAVTTLECSSAVGSAEGTYTAFFGDLGLCGRLTDDSNYILMVAHSTQGFILYKKVAGSFFNLAAAGGTAPVNGDTVKLTIDSSNNISTYLNGASQGVTATDSFNSTATKWGLRANNSTIFNVTPFVFTDAAGGGGTSFSYTASGGITFAGAAPKISKRVNTAAGGITFAGTSGQILKRINTAAGGITFAGTATQLRKAARAAAGGITFGGAATVSTHIARLIVTAAGGIVFGGAAAVSYVGRVARDWIIKMRRRRL